MPEKTQNITSEELQFVESSNTNVSKETNKNTSNEDFEKECVKMNDNLTKEDDNSEDKDNDFEKELDIDLPNLVLKYGTELYVVTVDGTPQCYTKTIQEARSRMWDIARERRLQENQFNTYIRERKNPNDIEVVGYNRFSIINVDRTICWLSVCRVQQVVKKISDTKKEFQMEKKELVKKSGFITSLFG